MNGIYTLAELKKWVRAKASKAKFESKEEFDFFVSVDELIKLARSQARVIEELQAVNYKQNFVIDRLRQAANV